MHDARVLDARAGRHLTAFTGGRMAWRRWGDAHADPLVLLHGASGSWTHWVRNIPALAERFVVLAPDLPGFGDSDDLPEPHTAERLAEAVTAGLDTLVPGPFALAGFSFGSIVAGLVAARLGTRVRHLILIGAGGLDLPIEAARLRLQRFTPGMSERETREVHRANLRTLMLADPAAADDFAVDLQVDNLRRTRFKSGDIPASDVLLRALPAVRAPLAALWGASDAFAAPRVDDRLRAVKGVHPDADVRVVPGAGHWAIYEAAAGVNGAMLEILSRARPAGSRGSA